MQRVKRTLASQRKVIGTIKTYLRAKFENEGTGHDWWHIERVLNNAITIAKREKGADHFLVQLGALLHDVADFKFHHGDEKLGGKVAAKLLKNAGIDPATILAVVHIVDNVSFKGKNMKSTITSIEGKIVQDADRLDAIGAIGIARAFAYGGYKQRPIYDPEGKIRDYKTFEQYKKGGDSTIHHFHEKLLHLRNLMNTKAGKKMATVRHEFIKNYLKEFYAEWNGKR
ncbi:MAG: HD domain-containing protein [Minisyncoccia bacterium]|jgi:uncharacterized protein